MSATSQWSPANSVSCSVGGVIAWTDSEYSEDVGTFETTNLASPRNANGLLCKETGVDVVTTTFRGNAVVDKAGVQKMRVGGLYNNFTWSDDLGETHTGSLRITKRGKKAATKGAFVVSYEGEFTGLVTGQ